MELREVAKILDANVLCLEEELGYIAHTACGSDMMSDVLAFGKNKSILLTGLLNAQAVRTAEMLDIACIIFVRGKCPEQNVVDLAINRGIVLMTTELPMFAACGILYSAGIKGETKN